MKKRTETELKRMARLVMAGAMVLSMLPTQVVEAGFRNSKRNSKDRGSSAERIQAAQKASEDAVKRMNANQSSIGLQGSTVSSPFSQTQPIQPVPQYQIINGQAVTPGQNAINERQQTISTTRHDDVKESLRNGIVSVPTVNAISAGGLLGDVLTMQEHQETQSNGNSHSTITGQLKSADGKILSFQGQFDSNNFGKNLVGRVNYEDGRTSEAVFEQLPKVGIDGAAFRGTITTNYPSNSSQEVQGDPRQEIVDNAATQKTFVTLDKAGNALHFNTTVYNVAGKSFATAEGTSQTTVDNDGNTTRIMNTRSTVNGVFTQTNLSEANGTISINGSSVDPAAKTQTTFNTTIANGKSSTNSTITHFNENGQRTLTQEIAETRGGVTAFSRTISGYVSLAASGGQSDYNRNGKPDAGEPWGEFRSTQSGIITQKDGGLVTEETSYTSYASGSNLQETKTFTSNGLAFVPLAPGLPAQATSFNNGQSAEQPTYRIINGQPAPQQPRYQVVNGQAVLQQPRYQVVNGQAVPQQPRYQIFNGQPVRQ
jgi:hypothetical protein